MSAAMSAPVVSPLAANVTSLGPSPLIFTVRVPPAIEVAGEVFDTEEPAIPIVSDPPATNPISRITSLDDFITIMELLIPIVPEVRVYNPVPPLYEAVKLA